MSLCKLIQDCFIITGNFKKTDEIVQEDETSKAVTRYSYITVLFRTTCTTNIILDLQSRTHPIVDYEGVGTNVFFCDMY